MKNNRILGNFGTEKNFKKRDQINFCLSILSLITHIFLIMRMPTASPKFAPTFGVIATIGRHESLKKKESEKFFE